MPPRNIRHKIIFRKCNPYDKDIELDSIPYTTLDYILECGLSNNERKMHSLPTVRRVNLRKIKDRRDA